MAKERNETLGGTCPLNLLATVEGDEVVLLRPEAQG
jgi:hypothetical protein